ncbi:MAG: ABC transporter ATP-binding protein [bacterium]|nr:MAG: ABC transporter ATP-binding protein [bacterium]
MTRVVDPKDFIIFRPMESTDKPSSKNQDSIILRHLWRLIKPYRIYLAVSIFIILAGKAIIVMAPLGIKYGIDIIEGNPVELSLFGHSLARWPWVELSHIGVFLFVLFIFQFATSYFQVYVTNYFGQNIMRDLRNQIFSHTLSQSLSFFDHNRVGQLLTRVVHDVQTLNELFVTGISSVFGDLFLIVTIIIISFSLDVKLAFMSFIILPFLYLGMILFKKYARKSFLEIRIKLAKMNAFLQAAISGIKIIQVFNKQDKMIKGFREIQDEYLKEYLRTIKIYALYFPGVEFVSILSRVLLLVSGGYWVATGEIHLSVVITFLFYSPMFFQPIKELSEQYNVLQAAIASSDRIFKLLETDEIIKDRNDPVIKKDFKGKIEFKNVSFAYQKGYPILKNVSFKIEAGEKVALVGVTGSGKSTIISLISRLYDIEEGEILIDDINIKDLRKKDLRQLISYVLQDVFIFSDSIKENIRLFDPRFTDEHIQAASEKVQAHRFIERLKDTYDEGLGERGVGISYGEKQLLAFARAFIHLSRIVIFDEATSNIDLETEELIQRNITEFIKDHTAIIIAHRLSTIREVDRIILLHKGEIKESGSHEELINQGGLYEKLYRLQFEDKD